MRPLLGCAVARSCLFNGLIPPVVPPSDRGPARLDVRLAEKNGKLIAYHGILTQRANFGDLLRQVKDFLTGPESSRETVVMSIQQGARPASTSYS